MKKLVLVLLILAVVGGTAFSFNIKTFPSPIKKGDFMISPTFSFGSYWGLASAIGITGAFDYALPTPIALTVGLEAGVGMVVGTWVGDDLMCLPILARIAWHPNFEVKNLDTYATLKLGYNVNLTSDKTEYYTYKGGFSYGFNVGARYFFSNNIGIFGELGYDRWGLSYEYTFPGYYGYGGYTNSFSYYIYTWVHLGITFKI